MVTSVLKYLGVWFGVLLLGIGVMYAIDRIALGAECIGQGTI